MVSRRATTVCYWVRACSLLHLRSTGTELTEKRLRCIAGDCDGIKKPTGGFPYIPGLDVSGTVTALDEGNAKCAGFKVGDEVVASWSGVQAEGGMAEFALVEAECAALRPDSVTPLEGAALVNSAPHAVAAVKKASIKPGDRLLILGGAGGVGHLALQYARHLGASYVAVTTTAGEMVRSLGVDRVIDYRSEDWADAPEFADAKLDVIIDCAVGEATWFHPKLRDVLKDGREGGRFVAVVANEWHIEMHNLVTGLPKIMLPPMWRVLKSKMVSSSPAYIMYLGGVKAEDIREVLQLADEGHLKVVLHEGKAFPFSEQGAKDMFNLMISRRGHGKVVMDMTKTC